MNSFSAHFSNLLYEISRRYRADIALNCQGKESLQVVVSRLAELPPITAPLAPNRLPACSLLPDVLALAQHGEMATIADAFGRIEAESVWQQNPNYSDAKLGTSYMDGYGHCQLVGPTGMIRDDTIMMGFLLLGPHRLYPDHHHPAAEVYHPVSGTAQWRKGDGVWQAQPPGNLIYHAPWVVHATQINEEPLLALYCWAGDIHVQADLVEGE